MAVGRWSKTAIYLEMLNVCPFDCTTIAKRLYVEPLNLIDLELQYTPLPQGDSVRVYFSESLYQMLQNEPC